MKNLLIFENEFSYIETPFEYVKDIYFDGELKFDVFPKSQELKPFSKIADYDFVFIDISLSKKSDLDGFGILQKIKDEKLDVQNIVILTGNHLIKEKLEEKQLSTDYQILTKPIDFEDLLKVLKPQ